VDTFLQQVINGLTAGSVYAIVALGYTMVYGIIQLINFAHGEVVMIGAMVAFTVINALAPSGLPALAVVLIGLARGFNADLFAILFGSILTVSPTDVGLIVALGGVVGVTIGTFYRQLLAITLNEDLARTSGVPVTGLNLLLTVLTALTTVVAMRMVGVLLVSAMIVIPTLTGFELGRSFRQATAIAVAMALASMTSGLIAAYYLRLAAGGAVVLTALIIFALASVIRRVAGALREARP